ncbi:hypothetical protein RBSWK_02585 [Rhodopirellula baltica SWK14]|uniref:Uncharacterized protein n=1 Tax=Rhodopirellula baltica SWK14 TaxID=993516 RepID=L7CGY1_RHOBT|nr:hypothetical protein RBSWK_02585 [Rhodopirellula baltica SWK14]
MNKLGEKLAETTAQSVRFCPPITKIFASGERIPKNTMGIPLDTFASIKGCGLLARVLPSNGQLRSIRGRSVLETPR